MPSVLWHCWLGGRKGIQPVKKSGGCWRGYLSGARCRLLYGPADATARKLNKEDAMDRCKWRKVIKEVCWPGWVWTGECFFWYRPTLVVPDKRPLNGCCWCYCHSLSLVSVKSRLVLPFWYRLTWIVPEKGPLNGCVCIAKKASAEVFWGYNKTEANLLRIFNSYTKSAT